LTTIQVFMGLNLP